LCTVRRRVGSVEPEGCRAVNAWVEETAPSWWKPGGGRLAALEDSGKTKQAVAVRERATSVKIDAMLARLGSHVCSSCHPDQDLMTEEQQQ
jgi:hypothetical protein